MMKKRIISGAMALLLLVGSVVCFVVYRNEARLYKEDSVRFSDQAVLDWCPWIEDWDVDPRGYYDMAIRFCGTLELSIDFLYGQSMKYMWEMGSHGFLFANNEEGTEFYSLIPYTITPNHGDYTVTHEYRTNPLDKPNFYMQEFDRIKCVLGAEKIFASQGFDDITIYNRYIISHESVLGGREGVEIYLYCETDQGEYVIYTEGKNEPFYLLPIELLYEYKEYARYVGDFCMGGPASIEHMKVEAYMVDLSSIEVSREDYDAILSMGPSKVPLYLGIGATVLCLGALAVFALSFRKKMEA